MDKQAPLLMRCGEAIRRRPDAVAAVQWGAVVVYAALLVLPVVLMEFSIPAGVTVGAIARTAFWAIWWPAAIFGVLLFGRAWCGLLCPEGTLTEFASRHGLRKPIPRWLRRPYWPFAGFLATTVYGQLIGVYAWPKAALLILGGSSTAACVIGYLYGPGKRVWCRYLCPVTGVFALLARLSLMHYAVDRTAWNRYPLRTAPVDCAPMLDIKHMQSASQCQSCGRCSGYRGAVAWAVRSPNREVIDAVPAKTATAEALLLVYGMLGIALAAFLWPRSGALAAFRETAAAWLSAHGGEAWLRHDEPWWLLAPQADSGAAMTRLDGASIAGYILAVGAVVGGVTHLILHGAARLAGAAHLDWKTLALTLLPLSAANLLAGLTMQSVAALCAHGTCDSWLPWARAALLLSGSGWSLWLAMRLLARHADARWRRGAAWICMLLPCMLIDAAWATVFFR